jgi:signal transduction histidine kinase
MFGRKIPNTLEELMKETVLDRKGQQLSEIERPISRALGGGRVMSEELQIQCLDGRFLPILVNAIPLDAGKENAPSVVVAFQDITAMKELERLRIEWGAAVAHDLRQPLHAMLMRTDLLARTGGAPEKDVQALARNVKRLSGLVQDIADSSRIELDHLPLQLQEVHLADVLSDCVENARAVAPDREIVLAVRDRDVIVRADPGRLVQIVDNLVGNAIKYGAPGTPILVAISSRAGMAEVAVENQGEGISHGELPHLFERFQRSQSAVAKGIPGMGLGLFIAKELVTAHGGEITCESEPGATTKFAFTLPRVEHEASAQTLLH